MTCNNNPANGATRHNYPPGIRIGLYGCWGVDRSGPDGPGTTTSIVQLRHDVAGCRSTLRNCRGEALSDLGHWWPSQQTAS
jgi:hypothetical protein